jgi:ABC-2 type transport system ATP-binding protein
MNIIIRDGGTISLLGADPERDQGILCRVGYLPEERGLYRKMTVIDVITFFAELKGVARAAARREGERWLERMGLGEWRGAQVETLSKGMQQKVQFITTVVHQPELLILDEPHSGLDPVNQEVLRDTMFSARDRGKTVIFSTHNMDQAEQLCDFVCIIANGQKVLDGRLADIKRSHAGHKYRIEFETINPGVLAMMDSGTIPGARRLADAWEVELGSPADVGRALATLSANGAGLANFQHVKPSLHQIFVERVGRAQVAERRPEVERA